MITKKHITEVIAVIMAAAVCLCLAAMAFPDRLAAGSGETGVAMEYETRLFDTSEPIRINILMDDGEWEEMLDDAMSETYYSCDVEINGETFYNVGIRPKGNTSLSSIVSDPDTDRVSLKLEFDHFVKGQTCFGLDKLILNNNYADATNMKEALVYDMYQYLGADASLYNYAQILVDGEYWGVYLALEGVEDSFLLRNYGVDSGKLYKPESMEIGGGNGQDNEPGAGRVGGKQFGEKNGERPEMPFGENGERPKKPDQAAGGFTRGGSGGADLNYTDDDPDSYETIWEGEIGKTTKKDHKRVISALKNISEGRNLEEYMDVDNLLRYMAVHVFSVNRDSLSGNMAHNYYLYEKDGQLNLLPWDYNLSWGGMGGHGSSEGGSSAESVINDAIDQAFSGTEFFDALMEDETCHAQYYAYLSQLTDQYVNGGGFDEFYTRTRNVIDSLVESDPTAFYSYEEYETAAETLYNVIRLRAESISGQIDGSIPSVSEEQQNAETLVDGFEIDISAMGSMNMGNGKNEGADKNMREPGERQENFDPSEMGQAVQDQPLPGQASQENTLINLLLYGGCLCLLLAVFLLVGKYRRKPYRKQKK